MFLKLSYIARLPLFSAIWVVYKFAQSESKCVCFAQICLTIVEKQDANDNICETFLLRPIRGQNQEGIFAEGSYKQKENKNAMDVEQQL